MTDIPGTLVASPRGLSHKRVGNSLQPSGQDVAVPSETQIDELFLESFILKSMVEGFVFNVMNGDIIAMSMYRAQATCEEAGLKKEEFMPFIQQLLDNFKKTTRKNPFHSMF
jgi:hypothetical protein